jgi:lipopolysaccharide/colanic/teichoic acid biosynthesis glycosyltransferase
MIIQPVSRDSAWPVGAATSKAERAYRSRLSAMRGRRQAVAAAALLAGDLFAVSACAVVAGVLAEGGGPPGWLVASVPAWPLLIGAYHLYGPRGYGLGHDHLREVRSLIQALLVGCFLAAGVHVAGYPLAFDTLALFGAVAAAALFVVRSGVRYALTWTLGPERVLLVGKDASLDRLARRVRFRRDVSTVGHTPTCETTPAGADHVIVEYAALTAETFPGLPAHLTAHSLRVSLLAPEPTSLAWLSYAEPLECGALISVRVRPPSMAARALKRASDVIGAAVAAVALAPVLVVLAVAIRLDSPGRVLFPQDRAGKGGRRFVMWKFRTMVADAEELRQTLLARSRDPNWLDLEEDPRITRVGRLLRRSSLDELPQLWNVLRGEMSLVGPRPLIQPEQEHAPAWARTRSDVVPGVTGLWQVAGRAAIPFEDMLRLDRVYVMTWSLRRDVEILLRTVPAVLTAKGAN